MGEFNLDAKRRELETAIIENLPGVDCQTVCPIPVEERTCVEDEYCQYQRQVAQSILRAIAPLVEIPDKTAELPENPFENEWIYAQGAEYSNSCKDKMDGYSRALEDMAGFHRTYSVEGRE
jgi:hypothetical protein